MRRAIPFVRGRRSSRLIAILVIAAGWAMMQSGTGLALDRMLSPLRFGVMHRAASGKVVVVEMDAASAAAIKRWPWSRRNYAEAVDRLRRAGAASIVFDVEFSAAGDAPGDRAFAAALARADGLVALPTFGQTGGSDDERTFDALPIPMLRRNVALASVSVAPDADGQVRSMPFGTVTEGTPRPSLSAYIAARSGTADDTFPIDMSIDPRTIPRLSFVAVRDGRFDPAKVRGRDVLIGATAIEMGDRYATPGWGVIPGVVVQAMAAETLLRGVPTRGSPTLFLLLAAGIVVAMVRLRRGVAVLVLSAAAFAGLILTALVLQHALQIYYPLPTALAMTLAGMVCCTTRDVIDRFRRQRATDEATGLPNARALLALDTSGPGIVAVAHIHGFDELHAVLGTAASDLVVRVAERLALAAADGTVWRIADRQLAFRLPIEAPVGDTLDGLRTMMLQPVEVAGRRVDAALTVGVAATQDRTIDRDLADATLAAEAARTAGAFWRHAATDIGDLERSVSLMGELDAALANGEIAVFYQPKYHLRQNRIASAEALVRWRHPARGFVGPDLFIPLAERTNRIGPLTLFVVERVMRDVLTLRERDPGFTAAVNISAKLLSDAAFNAAVEALLAAVGVAPEALVFEVTESAAMSDPAAAIAALNRYRELGIAVSMDDYGTGQSTLTYLRQLPLNELKIDRSFVADAHHNRNDGLLVASTIELAHQMGLKVVAEGVETAECRSFLETTGCDLIQGYLISKPVPFGDFVALLQAPGTVSTAA